jgi:hypothetical protein
MVQNNNTTPFMDECLIYHSDEDRAWIAHSLKTDQLGFGDCVVNALVDLLIGTKNLLKLKKKDPEIEIFHQASPEIIAESEKAKPLPSVLWEVALERFHKKLPYQVYTDIPQNEQFTCSFEEPPVTQKV